MADPFNTDHHPTIGAREPLCDGLSVVTAPNGGPMTFTGTRTYLLGETDVAIIDPGPDDPAHLAALNAALAGRRIGHILVTHAHIDHSPLARRLSRQADAPVYAFGPPSAGRSDVMNRLAAMGNLGGAEGIDHDFAPDITLTDNAEVSGNGWTLRAHHTPGHLSNHLCFEWAAGNALFSGDHVMGWASTLISPPDGDLGAFMHSLSRLESVSARRYFPGHGAPIDDGLRVARHLGAHRRRRGTQILGALSNGPANARQLVDLIYDESPASLRGAAARNVFAHLLDFLGQGRVAYAGELTPDTVFFFSE